MMNNEPHKGKPKTKWRETRVSLKAEMCEPTEGLRKEDRQGCMRQLVGGCCCCLNKSPVLTTIEGARDEDQLAGNLSGKTQIPSVEDPQIEINLVEVILPDEAKCPGQRPTIEDNPNNLDEPLKPGLFDTAANLDSNKILDDVKENFVTLISHNKLQYLMLSASIYTVMIIGNIFNYILSNQQEPIGPPTANGTTTTNHLMIPPSIVTQQESHHHLNSIYPENQLLIPFASWLIFFLYLPLLIGLIITLAITTLQFGRTKDGSKQQQQEQQDRQQILQLAGLLITIILLYLPSMVNLLIGFGCCFGGQSETTALSAVTTVNGEDSLLITVPAEAAHHHHETFESQQYQFRYWPMGSILVLVYLLPVLFEGSVLDSQARRLLIFLPAILLATTQLWFQFFPFLTRFAWALPADLALLQVICILLAFLFGLQMRRALVEIVTRTTFTGAIQLIEAKDSLEHERQQQETLLLSVLPAYVAEQVKRNMLKKTTSATCGSMADQADISASPAAGGAPGCAVPTIHMAPIIHLSGANSWSKSRSFITLHASSQSVDSTSTQPLVPVAHTETVHINNHHLKQQTSLQTRGSNDSIRARNSFHLPTKAITSGLAAISETLVSNDHHSNYSRKSVANHQTTMHQMSQHGMMNSQCSVGPAPGQARRGFNELYIRTYNNVSLLYGDIVGFTRLCTQLSSSQLVRVLNDLFSHFDHLAELHRIMRIKILGDCYYGVSGIPEFAVMGAKSRASRNDNHAINCVKMGLDMIHYIRCLNIERATSSGQNLDISTTAAAATTSTSAIPDLRCSPMPSFELNMRIGIHTGHIHSGVIGLKKWQFDVWSNDVSIAMHCESSGIAGRVQVTQATVQQLNGAFIYENGYGSKRDPFLASKDIQTYLIKDRKVQVESSATASCCSEGIRHSVSHLDWPISGHEVDRDRKKLERPQMDEFNIRAATIGTIKQTLLAGETCNANRLNSYGLALSHHDMKPLTLHYHDQNIEKLYANRPIEHPLQELAISFLLVILIYIINCLPPELRSPSRWFLIVLAIGASILLAINAWRQCSNGEPRDPIPTMDFNDEPLDSLEPHQVIKGGEIGHQSECSLWRLCPRVAEIARKLGSSSQMRIDRLVIMLISRLRPKILATMLISLSVIAFEVQQVVDIESIKESNCRKSMDNSREFNRWLQSEQYQLTVILLLFLLNSTLNLVSYRTRSILISIMLSSHLVKMLLAPIDSDRWGHRSVCNQTNEQKSGLPENFGGYQELIDGSSKAILVILMLWSLAFARQIEYTYKTNFLWRNKLNVDHEELEYISGINKVLLENILPSHVVQHYLTHPNEQPKNQLMPSLSAYMRMSFSNMRNQNSGLYHEQHDSVAVMFASIPHFYEFYDESDISKQGLGCIALLNEIICDFDKLLLKNKFSRIEKIKTIGSTYMAAAGLRPCSLSGARNSTVSQCSVGSSIPNLTPNKRGGGGGCVSGDSRRCDLSQSVPPNLRPDLLASGSDQLVADDRRLVMSQQKLNLICMIKFATSLMTALNGINKQSFQVFRLRIGVNTGPVIAGVIGALRPFYDIWGDCVNIASRMESLGEVGRIQVEEKTAKLLMESLCPDTHSIVRRGPIDVKGKGGMVTYFVDRIETSASNDGSHSQH